MEKKCQDLENSDQICSVIQVSVKGDPVSLKIGLKTDHQSMF